MHDYNLIHTAIILQIFCPLSLQVKKSVKYTGFAKLALPAPAAVLTGGGRWELSCMTVLEAVSVGIVAEASRVSQSS
jgi:hypothetical protein